MIGSLSSFIDNILQAFGRDDAIESVLKVGKVELLVKLVFESFVVYRDFLLGVLISPLECLEPVSLGQAVDMGKLGCGWVDGVIDLLVLFADFS